MYKCAPYNYDLPGDEHFIRAFCSWMVGQRWGMKYSHRKLLPGEHPFESVPLTAILPEHEEVQVVIAEVPEWFINEKLKEFRGIILCVDITRSNP